MEQQIEPDIVEREHNRAFIARVTSIITGAISGSLAGAFWLKRSLTHSTKDALYRPDWGIFHHYDREGKTTGEKRNYVAIDEFFRPESHQKEWLRQMEEKKYEFFKKIHVSGAPDGAVKAAYDDLCQRGNEVYENAIKDTMASWNKSLRIYTERMEKTIKELSGNPEKMKAEQIQVNERLRKFLYHDFKKHYETPVFLEIAKRGNKKSHMGLALRQADGKGAVYAFGAVAAVAMGAIAYKATNLFLHRNDEKNEPSHQQRMAARRKQASSEITASVMH